MNIFELLIGESLHRLFKYKETILFYIDALKSYPNNSRFID